MKYKGKIDYPKVGDEIIIKRYTEEPYKVVDTKYKKIQQGDLITVDDIKGVFVVLGLAANKYYSYKPLLVKRVFSDKLKPNKGGIDTACPEYTEPAEKFFTKEKKIHEEALNIINEYLGK